MHFATDVTAKNNQNSRTWAPIYEPGGRGFKSCRARQIINGLQKCGPFFLVWLTPG